jgi:hypothetical protein
MIMVNDRLSWRADTVFGPRDDHALRHRVWNLRVAEAICDVGTLRSLT